MKFRIHTTQLEDRLTPAFPLANHDAFTITPNTPQRLAILANDSFTDQVLISTFSTPPDDQGTLVRNSDDTFTFTPSSTFNGTSFSYTLAPRQLETTLVPASSDILSGGRFGERVVISADGNIAVVAAPDGRGGSTGATSGAGSIFVFARAGSGWTLRQKLFAQSDTSASASSDFGSSLAISADASTIAVGDPSTASDGVVYIFRRSGSGFNPTPQKIARPANGGVNFGIALALSADGSLLGVGDPNAAGGNTGNVANAGAVHLFIRNGNTFSSTPSQRLFAEGDATANGDRDFGRRITLSSDGNTLAVGDPTATGGATGSVSSGGAVYVFRRSGTTFGSTPLKLMQRGDATANAPQLFGSSMAIAGDGGTLAVGAPDAVGGNTGNVAQAGAVYVFRVSDGVFNPEPQNLFPNADNGFGVGFGSAIALDSDGTTLIVGDPTARGGPSGGVDGAGAVYVYRRAVENPFAASASLKMISNNGATNDGYGASASISEDGNTLLVGAFNAPTGTTAMAGIALIEELGSSTATVTLTRGPSPEPVGSDASRLLAVSGSPGQVRQITFGTDARGDIGDVFTPFSGYSGAVQSAIGDVNGDGFADHVYGIGPSGGSLLRIVSGKDGNDLIEPFATYESGFTGGIFVAVGDIDGDDLAEVVVSPDVGGGGRIQAFSFDNGSMRLRDNFFGIEDLSFRGGARVAVGDINGDNLLDLIVGAGFGGGPRIAIFDGAGLLTLASTPRKLVADFFAFPGPDTVTLRNGVFVAAGDLDGDGKDDLIFGGGPGGGPRVLALGGSTIRGDAFDPAAIAPMLNFFVQGDTESRGGVRVAARRVDSDDRWDLVVGSGEGQPSGVRTYRSGTNFPTSGTEPTLTESLDPFNAILASGVFVG